MSFAIAGALMGAGNALQDEADHKRKTQQELMLLEEKERLKRERGRGGSSGGGSKGSGMSGFGDGKSRRKLRGVDIDSIKRSLKEDYGDGQAPTLSQLQARIESDPNGTVNDAIIKARGEWKETITTVPGDAKTGIKKWISGVTGGDPNEESTTSSEYGFSPRPGEGEAPSLGGMGAAAGDAPAAPPSASPSASAPKKTKLPAGYVDEETGMRFIGGDPNLEENWKK